MGSRSRDAQVSESHQLTRDIRRQCPRPDCQQREQESPNDIRAEHGRPELQSLRQILHSAVAFIENQYHWVEGVFRKELGTADDHRDKTDGIDDERDQFLPSAAAEDRSYGSHA